MRKNYSILFLLAISTFALSQSQVHKNWWYMGLGAGCNFNSGSPVAVTNGLTNVNEGTVAMSDKTTGALLFYTDGMTIWNAANAIMTNGTGLMGNSSSTQSGMVVPRPGSTTQYYVFTVWPGSGLRYSIVDMTLSGGLGAVTATKNVLLGATTVDEKLTGCLHFNQTDFWVIVHMNSSNQFIAYPVTAGGIGAGVASNVGPVYSGAIGYMNISACGDKIGLSCYDPDMGVATFNNSTGVVSNYIDLNFGSNYSSGFSPDGTKFYHWSYSPTNAIYEVDLSLGTQAAINASRVQIGTAANWYGAFVYGRDGKIYIPSYNTANLHVINNPNLMGVACGYVANAVPLAGKLMQLGLPNFIEISACTILPIELKYFRANCKNESNVIEWETSMETDNDHFLVEKSSDGITFETVAAVKANTNNSTQKKYSVNDKLQPNTTVYYRLKQVDKNGGYKYFDPTALNCGDKTEMHVYPNPSKGTFRINGIQGENSVSVTNALGDEVYSEKNLVDITEINLSEQQPGIYFVKVESENQIKMFKVIINK